ncbi:MAG: aminotransferase class V-fold PLP-dependent enzyme [Oligoflexia bacterium]|nr:aminotransferase class V-fold PLP-dependent enzyme [Oligoflexia bacterium]
MNKLEPTAHDFKKMLDHVCKKIISHYKAREQVNEIDKSQEGMIFLEKYSKNSKIPENPSSFKKIIDELFAQQIPLSLDTSGSGYLAYVPGGGIVESAIAELITCYANRYIGVNFTAPLLLQIETQVIKWLISIVGYDNSAKGILTSGGSIANLHAMILAREDKLGNKISKGVLYGSSHTHHSIWKGAFAAGLQRKHQRIIEVNSDGKIDLKKLKEQIEVDLKKKLIPFFIVGNAGTTSCGRIDDFYELKKISKAYNLWFHIDAAYGGFFCLTSQGKKALSGMQQADSVTLDPHKGLFLPYGTGALLVNDGTKLDKTFSQHCSYIQCQDNDLWDFSNCSLELSREMRGMRIYLPVKKYGINAFRKALTEKIKLSKYTFKKLSQYKMLSLIPNPELTIINFRYAEASNLKNKTTLELLDFINNKNNVHLSGVYLEDVFYIRVCILSFRTSKKDIEALLADLRAFMKNK